MDGKSRKEEPKIFWYYANLIDYLRVVFALWAFWVAKTDYWIFIILYFVSFALDGLDGILARRYDQCSKLGATLDMVIDRVSTAGLLVVCSQFYSDYSQLFIFMVMLDVGSHWLHTHSSLMVNKHHKDQDELFWLIKFYYMKAPLFVTCLSAEIFLLLLYTMHFYPELKSNELFYYFTFFFCFPIYIFKQIISVLQIVSSSNRIAEIDLQEWREKNKISK